MKVLLICTEKLPVPVVRGGAIQTYIEGIMPYLRQNYQITVLGVNDPSLPDQETIDGVNFVRIPGIVYEIYHEGVLQFLQSNQFDIIHIFNRPRLVLPIRRIAPQSKLVLSMHNDMFTPNKIDPQEGKRVIDEVSAIVTVSNYIGNTIKQTFPHAAGKVQTIYSGVDINRFLPGNDPNMQKIRQQLRQEHGLEKKTVILFAGRISNNKGVDRLIRAIPDIAKKHRDIALVLMGSKWFSEDGVSDYVAYSRSLARKLPIPVVSTGFVSPHEIQKWFAASDLFVCTSIWQEPLARVHYEAMATGLPIITTARGGNPEVIMPGENGLIVENPENPEEFTKQITALLDNKNLMANMGKVNRKLALTRFQWSRVADDVLSVWQLV